jgi:hypothetical protein
MKYRGFSLFSWGRCDAACCKYAWSDNLSLGMVIMNCIDNSIFEGVIQKYIPFFISQFIVYHGEKMAIFRLNEITRSHHEYGVFYHCLTIVMCESHSLIEMH